MQGRINLEQKALLPFENIARKHDLKRINYTLN